MIKALMSLLKDVGAVVGKEDISHLILRFDLCFKGCIGIFQLKKRIKEFERDGSHVDMLRT